jgi:hypothetical protein
MDAWRELTPVLDSAFTYVGQEINPAWGYVTGWSMAMDYMLNPMICIIWCSKAAMNFAPSVPYAVWTIFFLFSFYRPQPARHSHQRPHQCRLGRGHGSGHHHFLRGFSALHFWTSA